MKKLIVIKIMCASLLFTGCCQTPASKTTFPCSLFGNNSCFFKQAFGNAIRSLEGSPFVNDATKIPAILQGLADNWLPAGNQFTVFIKSIVDSFVAAHPVTPDQVNKVLEAIAVQVQTGC